MKSPTYLENIHRQPHFPQRERGAVLLVCLMMLIVVTLLTFTSSKSVLLEEKITANARDDILAFQVAEAAVREAEKNVHDFEFSIDGGDKGLYDGQCETVDADCYINTLGDLFENSTWEKSTDANAGISCGNNTPACNLSGKYIIIKMGLVDTSVSGADSIQVISSQYQEQGEGAVGDVYKYKVIGRGTGINPDNVKVIVTYFASAEKG